jgi:TRAP-type mannitol/chloroaromatic compound transport system permease small subunit
MEQPPKILIKIIRVIDPIAIWSGNLVGWLIIPLVFGLTYEVVARYVFHAPTIWAFDVTYMLYASLGMLGAGYTLYKNGHIRTDILYDRWSPRRQGWVDVVCYVLLFFPGMFFFFAAGLKVAIHSWTILETSDASPWRPPLYPLKTVIPVTALLLLIQGVSEFLKGVYAVLRGERL